MTIGGSKSLCGFMVVRRPEMNFDQQGRGAYPAVPPRISTTYYGGLDRMPWFDIDEDYYSETLPLEIRVEYDRLCETNRDLTGVRVCRDLDVALAMLKHSNSLELRNEIIAVHSGTLSTIKGAFVSKNVALRFRGYDPVDLGHWSLLREGVFAAPESLRAWPDRIQVSGLLSSVAESDRYVRDYKAAAEKGSVEVLAPEVYGIDAIEVWDFGSRVQSV